MIWKEMKKIMASIVVMFTVFGSIFSLNAQQKVQVVSKVIEKEFAIKSREGLKVLADRANIKVKGWNKNKVKITLKLVAKHPDKELAVQELEFNKYKISKEDDYYSVTNFFNPEKGTDKVQSKLSASYEIFIPKNAKLAIRNRYGSISIEDIESNIHLAGEFCEMDFKNVQGKLFLESKYGDVYAYNLDLGAKIGLLKSDLDFQQAAGDYQITSEYGRIDFMPAPGLQRLDINSKRTVVKLLVSHIEAYNYFLTTSYSEIRMPNMKDVQVDKSEMGKRIVNLENGDKPYIRINTSFSPIIISYKSNFNN